MVVDGGSFDWAAGGKYPGITEPDESYHGLRYTEAFGPAAFAVKLRGQLLRDLGCVMAPMNAFLTMQGLQNPAPAHAAPLPKRTGTGGVFWPQTAG